MVLAGDLNSRCGNLHDFIGSDTVHESVTNNLSSLFEYQSDDILPDRICPDQAINTYGLKLIQLCIESGLRILNGRHSAYSADFTYCGPNGYSVIDYVLTTQDMFNFVKTFIVCNFNTFSDHAPLHIELKSTGNIAQDNNDVPETTNHTRFRWNDSVTADCRLSLEQNIHRLEQCFNDNDITTENGIDNCVSHVCQRVI